MINDFNNKILIIAGEVSGDMHGAALVSKIKNSRKSLQFYGVGGSNMIAEGVETLYHIKDMAFLGFVEVIKHLPFILKVERGIIDFVKVNKIKLAVLIDYPGFNLRIAKKLKKLGVKIIYYISPQIWAWHQSRIKKIKQRVNKMLVVFPFEKKFYEDGNIPVEYVGHPLVERIEHFPFASKKDFFTKFKIEKEVLLILPGSRKHEIEKHLPELLKSAEAISSNNNMQTVVACSENLDENFINSFIKNDKVKIIKGNTYNLFKHSKFGIIKSGTSTLEATIIGLPFVVIYSTSKTTYALAKRLVKIKHIAMPNIIADKTVVREFIQDEVNSKIISNFVNLLLNNNDSLNRLKFELSEITKQLGSTGASKNVAKIIIKMIDED